MVRSEKERENEEDKRRMGELEKERIEQIQLYMFINM